MTLIYVSKYSSLSLSFLSNHSSPSFLSLPVLFTLSLSLSCFFPFFLHSVLSPLPFLFLFFIFLSFFSSFSVSLSTFPLCLRLLHWSCSYWMCCLPFFFLSLLYSLRGFICDNLKLRDPLFSCVLCTKIIKVSFISVPVVLIPMLLHRMSVSLLPSLTRSSVLSTWSINTVAC